MLMRVFLAMVGVLGMYATPSLADFDRSKVWFENLSGTAKIQVQLNLLMLADYEGLIDSKFGQATYQAILRLQEQLNEEPTGVLGDGPMRLANAATEERLKGWGLQAVEDRRSRSSLFLPATLLPKWSPIETGTLYASKDDQIGIATFRQSLDGASFKSFYDVVANNQAAPASYSRFKESFFVAAGEAGDASFYTYVVLDQDDAVGFHATWTAEAQYLGRRVATLLASNFVPAKSDKPSDLADADNPQQSGLEPGITIGGFFLPDEMPSVIRFTGDIKATTPLEFIRALRERSGVKVLELASDGGLVDPALIVAHEVHSRDLETRIAPGMRCVSACAFVFLAGRQRSAQGELGVHQVWNERNDLVAGQAALSDVLEAMSDFGVDQRVMSVMLRTKPEDMHVFTKAELQRFGIEKANGDEAKTEERLATASNASQVPNVEAAVDPADIAGSQSLLLEASDDGTTGAVPFSGTVEWSRGTDEVGQPTLVGKANIPARNLSVDVLIRKNSDPSLPASHLMEINFNVSETFVGGSITQLPGVLLKNEELVQGTPLVGAISRAKGNSFVFALSSSASDVATNQQLLTSRMWMDLAVTYGTGKRAIITFEKDDRAQMLFKDVFAQWTSRVEAPPNLRVPEYLLGQWETDLANCDRSEPLGGEAVFFRRERQFDEISIVNWETEGGTCEVLQVSGASPSLSLQANCGMEENPKVASALQIYLAPSLLSITVSSADFGVGPTDYQRCAARGQPS